MKTTNKKAFTLVELLVVVTIIAILSVTAYMALGGQTIKARDARRQQDLNTLQSAIEVYFIEHGNYPAATSGVVYNDGADRSYSYINSAILTKKYISKIPIDPKKFIKSDGTEFELQYQYDVDGKTFQLAATLETEEANPMAYVIGNYEETIPADPDSIIEDPEGSAVVTDGDTTDLPYRFQ